MKKKFVGYFRVSSARQGISGLGLEAQKQAVNSFIKDGELIAEFVEVETGTRKRKRIEIYKALNLCKQENAVLVLAKLDRLARNVLFTATLMESGVDFVCVDNPHANRLTIHILSAIAEYEAKLISERTKAALAIAKQKGKKIGSPQNLTKEAMLLGVEARKQIASENENNRRATGYIISLQKAGYTFQKIADELNMNGFKSSKGRDFQPSSVYMLWDRAIKINHSAKTN